MCLILTWQLLHRKRACLQRGRQVVEQLQQLRDVVDAEQLQIIVQRRGQGSDHGVLVGADLAGQQSMQGFTAHANRSEACSFHRHLSASARRPVVTPPPESNNCRSLKE